MFSIVANMNGRNIGLAVMAGVLLFCAPLAADDEGGGTVSPFALGAGGRNIAMGGTRAAVWGGSYALLWNPAGLCQLERGEVSMFHTKLFDESCSYSSLIGSYPFTDMGVVSFGVLRLEIGGIERRDWQNLPVSGELSNKQIRYVFGYAKDLYRGFYSGVSMKMDRFAQGSYVANGFGLDIGFGFRPDLSSRLVDGAAFGLTFFNVLEPKFKLAFEESGDPYGTRAGFALWRSLNKGLDDRFLLAVDIDKTKYDDARMHFGCEYSMKGMFAARGGWDSGFPTFGFGFNFYSIQIDYAYRNSDLDYYHLFSLSYEFGPSKGWRLEKRKQMREEKIKREIEKETIRYEAGQIENSLSKAREALAKQKFKSATEYFETVLLWDPENREAKAGKLQADGYILVMVADSLFEAGKYGEALLQYRRGNEALKADVINTRIEKCEEIISRTTNQKQMIENMFARALELYSERKWSESAKVFNQVLDLAPDHDIARNYYDKANARFAEEYSRVLRRIQLSIGKNRYGEALEEVRAGLEMYPGDNELEKQLAEVSRLKKQGESAAQISASNEADEIVLSRDEIEELRPIYDEGVEFFKNGEFDKAIGEWENVWKRYAKYEKVEDYLVKAYLYWGMELYTKHDYQEALKIWGKVLEVDPDNEKAVRYIRRTREELGRLESVSG